jgi:hypothetical protein
VPSKRKISDDTEVVFPPAGVAAKLTQVANLISPIFDGVAAGETHKEAAERMRSEAVADLAQLILQGQAFDMLGLVRMLVLPANLEGYRESESSSSPALLELIASMVLHRPEGERPTDTTSSGDPRPIVAAADRAVSAQMWLLLSEGNDIDHPVAELAADFRSAELRIRGRQYGSIQREVEEALFEVDWVSSFIQETLGFKHAELQAIRSAFGEQWSENRTRAMRDLQDIADAHGLEEPSTDVTGQMQNALNAALFKPGYSMTVSAEEIAVRCGLSESTCSAVLDTFAVTFGTDLSPTQAANAFLDGSGPFPNKNLIRGSDGRYFPVGGDLGMDGFRAIFESAAKSTKGWTRYQKHRGLVAEKLVAKALKEVFSPDVSYDSLGYFRPRPDTPASALGKGCTDPSATGEPTEADTLLVIDDVAICVEVKAAGITAGARQGSLIRLAKDLSKTVGDATFQANRLADLIETNRGLWTSAGHWLDLGHVREIRSLAVTLDDLSSLNCSLDALVRAGVIDGRRHPWVVSLHDLLVTTRILNRPSELLLYLRRRTDSEVVKRYVGVDELDFVMCFVDGQLWVEPDPTAMIRKYPRAPRPSKAEQRRYSQQAEVTRVGTYTDELDAWMYFQEGLVSTPSERPSFRVGEVADALADMFSLERFPGWLCLSVDILGGATTQRAYIESSIENLLKAARLDGQAHSLFVALPGPWGFSSLVLGTPGEFFGPSFTTLKEYGEAKQYQLGADRCLIAMIDSSGAVLESHYSQWPIEKSEQMDSRVGVMALQPPTAGVQKPPPYARRATSRLRGKKR